VANPLPSSGAHADRSQATWFRDELERLFAEAAEAAGVVERRYSIAGANVLLRFAGPPMLERFGGAFAHLETPFAGPPALRVDVWDSDSTGTDPPPQLGEPVEIGPENGFAGPVYYYEAEAVQALARWRTLAALDSRAATAWFWAPSPERMLSWDWAYPIRPILDWWLSGRGIVLSHGGAVGTPEGGIALVGRGRSGKSTSALSSIGSGLRYGGDDLVGIDVTGAPRLYSLYTSGKLTAFHFERFPHLARAVVNPIRGEAEKGVVYVHEEYPDATVADFPLRAIVVPKITDRVEPRLIPATPAAALTALAPSTILQAPPHRPESLRALARVVQSLPNFYLELGSNLGLIPQVVLEFLEHA
jgi:hypothetical protein